MKVVLYNPIGEEKISEIEVFIKQLQPCEGSLCKLVVEFEVDGRKFLIDPSQLEIEDALQGKSPYSPEIIGLIENILKDTVEGKRNLPKFG